MEITEEVEFMNHPHILDGTNYDYWKARTVSFPKSMDSKTWKEVIKGWTPLNTIAEANIEVVIS